MPKFLERKLKKQYGEDSDVPYKIMNKMGFMRGSKTTTKGKAAERKHESKFRSYVHKKRKRHGK